MKQSAPMVIVIGGFAGTGKTYHSQRLSTELSIPRLSSDAIGQTISGSRFFDASNNAIAIAYDLVFGLCNDFLRCGVSTVLDLNMAWEFQWQHLDALREQHAHVRCVPIILRAPWDVCLDRIRRRHAANPDTSAPPEVFETTQHILDGWAFLERLDRPDITVIDAARSEAAVYEDIKHCDALATGSDVRGGTSASGSGDAAAMVGAGNWAHDASAVGTVCACGRAG